MIARLFLWLTRSAPGALRRLLWRALFESLAAWIRLEWWTFMNYGYHEDGFAAPGLAAEDEDNRYPIHLYHRVVDGIDLAGKDVIEIGSGRGGGAAFVKRYHAPRLMVGLDLSREAVAFCRRVHRQDGLEFTAGDAEHIPFPPASFDAVINVESSFCYPSMDRFLAEVRRILRPNGHFLFTDIRLVDEIPALQASLEASGLELVRESDITANVSAALRLDAERRRQQSRKVLPWPFQGWLDIFIGIEGTRIPEGLKTGQMVYVCCLLRKPGQAAPSDADADAKAALETALCPA